MDATLLPPCSKVLREKVKRVNFVAGKLSSSTQPNPPFWLPENNGWILNVNGYYQILYNDGPTTPDSLEAIITPVEDGGEDSDDEEECENHEGN